MAIGSHLSELPTPFLVIYRDVAQRNADRMLQRAADLGVALRPHVKTHKTVQGELQLLTQRKSLRSFVSGLWTQQSANKENPVPGAAVSRSCSRARRKSRRGKISRSSSFLQAR